MKRANQQKTNLVQINVQVLKKARDASKKFNQNPIISSLISLSLSLSKIHNFGFVFKTMEGILSLFIP